VNFLFLSSARRWGGNEKWTRMAAHALAKGHGVRLAYRTPAVGSRFEVPGHRLPFLNEADLVTLAGIARIVRRHRVDVLIATKPKDYVIAGVVSRLLRRRTLIRLGIVRDLRNSPLNDLVYNRLNDGVIVNAPEIKETLLRSRYMRSKRIRVIFNGIDGDELDALAAQGGSRAGAFPFTVCAMGELSARKSFDVVIEGFARFLRPAGPDAIDAGLTIIGEGQNRPQLEALARSLGIAGRVVFTGSLENPFPVLRSSDVFVQGSKNEGISNALLEAMYLGNAVISTSAGGSRHAIEDGESGFLVDAPDRAGQIGHLLARLYLDPELRRRTADAGRQSVARKFLLSRMTEEIVDFASEATSRPSERAR
jgi:glycosyltransferase involved in cell wall biosynthesis